MSTYSALKLEEITLGDSGWGTSTTNNLTGNTWTCTGQMSVLTGTTALTIINGRVAMAGALDRIYITTVSGTNTFLTGTMNVLYE